MDLLADYASSDEEIDGESKKHLRISELNQSGSIFALQDSRSSSSSLSSLPPTKIETIRSSNPPALISGSRSSGVGEGTFFSSLPPPKSHSKMPEHRLGLNFEEKDVDEDDDERVDKSLLSCLPTTFQSRHQNYKDPGKPSGFDFDGEDLARKDVKPRSAMFFSLPIPKTEKVHSLEQSSKRVVKFTLPLNPSALKLGDSDEDEENDEKGTKSNTDTSSSISSKGLFAMLPAPKNSLCLAPSSQPIASARRSALDANVEVVDCADPGVQIKSNIVSYEGYEHYSGLGKADIETYAGAEDHTFVSSWLPVHGAGEDNGNYPENSEGVFAAGNGQDYAAHSSNWYDGSTEFPAEPGFIPGKRGRNEIPAEIVEVNQDELMKNRPREDQARVTGIAFGPSYQPVSSAKGKPSKLHKRKHQIGSLYFDMKQKETELAERRAKGLLTKSQTQGKYGW